MLNSGEGEKVGKILAIDCTYTKTVEKARGGIEKREYWQSEDIAWMA